MHNVQRIFGLQTGSYYDKDSAGFQDAYRKMLQFFQITRSDQPGFDQLKIKMQDPANARNYRLVQQPAYSDATTKFDFVLGFLVFAAMCFLTLPHGNALSDFVHFWENIPTDSPYTLYGYFDYVRIFLKFLLVCHFPFVATKVGLTYMQSVEKLHQVDWLVKADLAIIFSNAGMCRIGDRVRLKKWVTRPSRAKSDMGFIDFVAERDDGRGRSYIIAFDDCEQVVVVRRDHFIPVDSNGKRKKGVVGSMNDLDLVVPDIINKICEFVLPPLSNGFDKVVTEVLQHFSHEARGSVAAAGDDGRIHHACALLLFASPVQSEWHEQNYLSPSEESLTGRCHCQQRPVFIGAQDLIARSMRITAPFANVLGSDCDAAEIIFDIGAVTASGVSQSVWETLWLAMSDPQQTRLISINDWKFMLEKSRFTGLARHSKQAVANGAGRMFYLFVHVLTRPGIASYTSLSEEQTAFANNLHNMVFSMGLRAAVDRLWPDLLTRLRAIAACPQQTKHFFMGKDAAARTDAWRDPVSFFTKIISFDEIGGIQQRPSKHYSWLLARCNFLFIITHFPHLPKQWLYDDMFHWLEDFTQLKAGAYEASVEQGQRTVYHEEIEGRVAFHNRMNLYLSLGVDINGESSHTCNGHPCPQNLLSILLATKDFAVTRRCATVPPYVFAYLKENGFKLRKTFDVREDTWSVAQSAWAVPPLNLVWHGIRPEECRVIKKKCTLSDVTEIGLVYFFYSLVGFGFHSADSDVTWMRFFAGEANIPRFTVQGMSNPNAIQTFDKSSLNAFITVMADFEAAGMTTGWN